MTAENQTFSDFCICCGEPVPEGRMVCRCCERKGGAVVPLEPNRPPKGIGKLLCRIKKPRKKPRR